MAQHNEQDEPPTGRRTVLRFVLLFAVSLLAFQLAFLFLVAGSDPFARYLALCARLAGGLVALVGFEATVDGNRLEFGDHLFLVTTPCSGLQPMAMLAIAVFAFPASRAAKLLGAALGVAALFALNLVRIASLCFVQRHAPDSFELVHLSLWPMVLILCSIAFWAVWARRVAQP